MDDPRIARSVPFPLVRPDAVIRYRTKELKALCDIMASYPQPEGAGTHWLAHVEQRLRALDVGFIMSALRLGLKTGDHFTPLDLPEGDDLRFSLKEATRPISDALLCAIAGISYAELQVKRQHASPQLETAGEAS